MISQVTKYITLKTYRLFILFLLGYTLVIILWGAFVRISGSGDGCGEHWPLCEGMLIPSGSLETHLATWIEYFHRVKSGLYGFFILAAVFVTFRLFPKATLPRKIIVFTFGFTTLEALIGAALVLFGWVDQNESVARVLMMSVHLMNTFCLLGSLVFLYFSTKNPEVTRLNAGPYKKDFVIAVFIFFLMAITGSWAAFSSTLFPSESLASGVLADFSADSSWFMKIRVFHPLVTTLSALILFVYSLKWKKNFKSSIPCYFPNVIVIAFIVGWMTLLSLSPTWLKLSHLLLTDTLWIVMIGTIAQYMFGAQRQRKGSL